jgi:hypothetical protein
MINHNGQLQTNASPTVLGFPIQYEWPERRPRPCLQEYNQSSYISNRVDEIIEGRRATAEQGGAELISESSDSFAFRQEDQLTNMPYGIQNPNALDVVLPQLAKMERKTAWEVLESLIGTIEAPGDWASEHNHYLYGTPRRNTI